ncbi:MAG: DNA mismatch repair endonuclease MutL [Patescibacteria group bacterium]|nr:DNA mismatch repair endonuclease MutL [Patescibacteria group bacterium]
MGKIRILPPEVAAKIAAGEVVERPAYALKELLENAIDAQATDIKIILEESGLKKIAVLDNGEGMDQEDLRLCFLPHTTSKLSDDTLTNIATLGFRGEALASIAAISNLKIISRKKEKALGYLIEVSDNKIDTEGPVGTPTGTSVSVENLFGKLPARKKFLKTPRTEYRHLLEIVTQYALAYPTIRFELHHNQKTIFDLPKKQKLEERIKLLLGKNIFENLVPINYEESYLKISGFLCKPQLGSPNTNHQYLFVNNRRIYDNLIAGAVKEGFGSLLEANSYPLFLLFLQLPKELIDVNIHPRKEKIAFGNSEFLYLQMQKAVTQTLADNNLTFYNLSFIKDYSGRPNSYLGKLLKDEVLPYTTDCGKISPSKGALQIHNLYLLCQTPNGLLLLDQHAAHERILFAQFEKAFKKHQAKKEKIHLAKAILLELPLADSQALLENLEIFRQIGFEIEEFGENVFKVEAIPKIFQDWDIAEIIKETLIDLATTGRAKEIDNQTKKMLSYLACRSAIKAGEKLTQKQIKKLLKELSELNLAYTCPHGRPLKVEISLAEIDRMFKR